MSIKNKQRVDLQIIYFSPNCKEEWFLNAINSVKDEPINLSLYEGHEFGPLHLRQEFIEKSNSPYIGWIDDDDELIPGTIQQCVDFLDRVENQHYCGVYTNYEIMDEDSITFETIQHNPYDKNNIHVPRKRPFHFTLLRNQAARQCLKIPAKFHGSRGGDTLLINAYATSFGDWYQLPITGYRWRSRKDSQGKKLNGYAHVVSHCIHVVYKEIVI